MTFGGYIFLLWIRWNLIEYLSLFIDEVGSISFEICFNYHILNAFHILFHIGMNVKEKGVRMEVTFLLRNHNVLTFWVSLIQFLTFDVFYRYCLRINRQEPITSWEILILGCCKILSSGKRSCIWKSSLGSSSSIRSSSYSLSILSWGSYWGLSLRICQLPYSFCLSIEIWAQVCNYLWLQIL